MEQTSFDPAENICDQPLTIGKRAKLCIKINPIRSQRTSAKSRTFPKSWASCSSLLALSASSCLGPERLPLLLEDWCSGPKRSAGSNRGWSEPTPKYTERECSKSTAFLAISKSAIPMQLTAEDIVFI